jgi:hypothetical protein
MPVQCPALHVAFTGTRDALSEAPPFFGAQMDTLPDLERSIAVHVEPGHRRYSDCIDACLSCELACAGASESLLGSNDIGALRDGIGLALDCADVCSTTARLLARMRDADAEVMRSLLEACARACASCGAECHRLGVLDEACRACAVSCRRCEAECDLAIAKLHSRRS